jgi:hypothetical protein
MPRKVKTPREIVEAYIFWKWEYERRNEDYIKAYDKLIKLAEKITGSQHRPESDDTLQWCHPWDPLYIYKIEDEKMKTAIDDFRKTYGKRPKDPKYGCSAKEIAEFLAEERKKPDSERSKYPAEEIKMQGWPVVDFLGLHMGGYYRFAAPAGVTMVERDEAQKKLLVLIDMTQPLRTILEGITKLHLMYYEEEGPTSIWPVIEYEFGILKNVLKSELRDFRDWEARAAGLLLRDYIHICKKGCIKEAAAIDDLKDDLIKLGYHPYHADSSRSDHHFGTHPRRLRTLLYVTEHCIDQREVLPIGTVKGRRRLKVRSTNKH